MTTTRQTRPRPRRHAMPAGRTFIVIAVCLLVWTLLYAPELRRSAEAAPAGTRRSRLAGPVVPARLGVRSRRPDERDRRGLARRRPRPERGRRRRRRRDRGRRRRPARSDRARRSRPNRSCTTREMREPSFDHQLRVAVVGDSLAAGIGYFAERVFKPFFVEVYKQGRISTGLARPDFFNWPAQMQHDRRPGRPRPGPGDARRERQPGAAELGRVARAGHRHVRLGRPLRGSGRAVRQDRRPQAAATSCGSACRTSATGDAGTSSRNRTRSTRRSPTGCRTSPTSTRGTRSRPPTAATAPTTATATG